MKSALDFKIPTQAITVNKPENDDASVVEPIELARGVG